MTESSESRRNTRVFASGENGVGIKEVSGFSNVRFEEMELWRASRV